MEGKKKDFRAASNNNCTVHQCDKYFLDYSINNLIY